MTRKSVKTKDSLAGKIKRVTGELTGRPDLVLEGEAQDTGRLPENATGAMENEKNQPRQSTGREKQHAEHEEERLNPGGGNDGSATGAPANKPSGPSNSA